MLALEAGHALDLDLLADGGVGLVEELLDGAAVLERRGQQGLGVSGLGGHGLVENLRGQGAETLALGHEVGLAQDLDEGALAAGGGSGDQPVGGRATLALGHALQALDTKDLLGLGHVAIGLVEGLLDVHHSGGGLLAERLDVSGGVVRHVGYRSFG